MTIRPRHPSNFSFQAPSCCSCCHCGAFAEIAAIFAWREDGEEGSLTRLSAKIFVHTLVEEHNADGKHLELHQPVCVGHQFKDGVVFGCHSTPMLLLHMGRGINSGWPFLAGFDTTFGITSKKFELMGISVNSLRRRANPVCLCYVKKDLEEAIAYAAAASAAAAAAAAASAAAVGGGGGKTPPRRRQDAEASAGYCH